MIYSGVCGILSIKKADKEDIGKISKFLDDYYREDYFVPTSRITRMVTGEVERRFGNTRKPMHVFLTEDEKGITGLAIMTMGGTLIQLLVRDDMRGHGIGTALLEFVNPKKSGVSVMLLMEIPLDST